MNKTFIKALCAGVTISLIFSSVVTITSCGKKPGDSSAGGQVNREPLKAITEDMPWYDTTTVIADEDINKADFYFTSNHVIGVIEGNILVSISGYKVVPPEMLEDEDFNGYNGVNILRYYDTSGVMTDEVDLKKRAETYVCSLRGEVYNEETGEVTEDPNPPSSVEDLGEIYLDVGVDREGALFVLTGFSSALMGDIELRYDPVAKEFVSYNEIDSTSTSFSMPENNAVIEGYEIRPTLDFGVDLSFEIVSPDGGSSTVSLRSELPEMGVPNSIMRYIYAGDGKLIVYVYTQSYEEEKFILDFYNGCCISMNGDRTYDWIDDLAVYESTYFDGIGNVFTDDSGIKVIDMDAQCITEYLSYDSCNVNRYDIWSIPLLYMDDEMIILGGAAFRGAGDYLSDQDAVQEIVILKKADTNPNAGKAVLNAAFVSGFVNYSAAEAIRQFNEESSDAIILIDPRYTAEAMASSISVGEGDSYEAYNRSLASAVVTALAIDLMSGEGPDLMFDGIRNTQLNNPELLMDLSSMVDRDGCFVNIIDSAMTGDALYQLPLAFTVEGIMTSSDNVSDGATGFTFEEYRDFVYGPCNGIEPTSLSRIDFMNKCIEEMSDVFCVNGTYGFNNDDFRQLAEFTAELIPEGYITDEFNDESYTGGAIPEASYVNVCSASQMLVRIRGPIDDYRLLGLPSADARGPMAAVTDSIAVSATTEHANECLSFVDLLMTEDYQHMFARNSGFSINREAFEQESYRTIEDSNYKFENYFSNYFTASELFEMGHPVELIDADSFVSTLESYVDSISGIGYMDAPVQIIVSEETQAYFAGQKSLDEILEIIDDRVATYVNERQN